MTCARNTRVACHAAGSLTRVLFVTQGRGGGGGGDVGRISYRHMRFMGEKTHREVRRRGCNTWRWEREVWRPAGAAGRPEGEECGTVTCGREGLGGGVVWEELLEGQGGGRRAAVYEFLHHACDKRSTLRHDVHRVASCAPTDGRGSGAKTQEVGTNFYVPQVCGSVGRLEKENWFDA